MTMVSTQTATPSTQKIGPAIKKPLVIVSVLVILAICGGLIYYFVSNSGSKDWRKNTVKVERGPIDVRIEATGTIKPVNEIKVSPKVTGLIKKLTVKQGDIVKEGQILAEMDKSNLLGAIEASRGSYLMAQDTYEKLQHGNRPQEVAIAELQERRSRDIVRQAVQNTIRLKAMVESATQTSLRDDTLATRQLYLESQGAASDQDRLNAETQAKVTRAQLDAAKRELAGAEAALAQNKAEAAAAHQTLLLSQMGNRQEDISQAKHAVIQAKGNLDSLLSQLDDMIIRAPFAGVITQKYADAGAIVTPTTSAATTSATSSSIVALAGVLEMVAQVAETDIGKIEIGQEVEILSNAYPEHPFHGHVTQIAPEAVVTQNVTTFEVHTTIDDDRKGKLLAGMNVSARFVAGRMNNALLVPTVCIVSRHGKTGVLIPEKDGNPTFKPVKTGPTSGTRTVVMRGLNDGDLVFVGLSKEGLEQQGYGDGGIKQQMGGGRQGGGRHGGGGGTSVPIPRSFGH
ncbi:MAG: efflux RND transporter periplasmic adaptor subunit [Cyanobacteria bacterium REEB67]|nr:efflux RND transporter periplasmic adaptor subunit [Cyanobacteria bacterium REEB67]